MARIGELVAQGPTVSFEFMPPKTDEMLRQLEKTLRELEPMGPSFVSVTYGAGGSTRERTQEAVLHIHRDTSMVAMPHLTCVGHTRAELEGMLAAYKAEGIENVLALAGDPQPGSIEGDFRYAVDLIELVREVGGFDIGVAAHPEVHPKSPDRATDRQRLAAKLSVADFGITQFFFEAEPYLRMVDELAALGVATPVLPGILPILNVESAKRFATMGGATFPTWLSERLDPVADKPAEVRKIGVEAATNLASELLEAGVPGLHLYTLNTSRATKQILANLGLR